MQDFKFFSLGLLLLATQSYAGPYTYVTNSLSNTVSVINIPTNTVSATINVGTTPKYVAISPNGLTLYVSNEGSDDVTVIDTTTNAVITTIPVGHLPSGLAVTLDNTKVYVANNGSSGVSVIDAETNTVIKTISTFPGPINVAMTPDGVKAYVPCFALHGTASVIRVATDSQITVSHSMPYPFGITIPELGGKAYITDFLNAYVTVLNTRVNQVATTVPTGNAPYGIAVAPDSDHLYVTNQDSNSLSVIGRNDDSSTEIFTLGLSTPKGIAITPDGFFAYIANYDADEVSVVELSTLTTIGTISTENGPTGVATTPGVFAAKLVTGFQTKNVFLTETDRFNTIRWTPPEKGLRPVFYNVYQNSLDNKIATVFADDTLEIVEHNVQNSSNTYYIISVDQFEGISEPATITINS